MPSRRLTIVAVLVSLIFLSTWYNQREGLKAVATETHSALCALRDDVERRRDGAVKYLDEHPMGVVSPRTGAIIITAAQIQQGIDNQTSTLEALDRSGLTC